MEADAVPPLAGFTVGVTAARKAEEFATMLERRGASVLHGPALRIVALADDTDLRAATTALVGDPPDVTVATTAVGYRGWLEAADGWGIGDDLRSALGRGELIARGPKARGAIRGSGLVDAWSPESESTAEVLDHLLGRGVEGLRIAVQLHGDPLRDVVEALEHAGAEVTTLPVYRWAPPADLGPLDRLLDAVPAGRVDVLAFTSAPAVAGTLARAAERGRYDELVAALRGPLMALCVGPVTAAPLEALDVPTVQPERSRLGAMVRTLEEITPSRAPRMAVGGHEIEVRGSAVVVDGELRPVAPGPMAVLRALARDPGRVVPFDELPASGAAELRAALGVPDPVETVAGRGLRLASAPDRVAGRGNDHRIVGGSG